jgi:hypothetical protein
MAENPERWRFDIRANNDLRNLLLLELIEEDSL